MCDVTVTLRYVKSEQSRMSEEVRIGKKKQL